jgi:tetratricopeptide (TPR) repeat protein
MQVAESRARRRNAVEISPTLLLLGVMGAERDLCLDLMEEVGASLAEVESRLLQTVPREPEPQQRATQLSAEAQTCLRRAAAFAARRGGALIEPLDLLLALVVSSAEVGRQLPSVGVDTPAFAEVLRTEADLPDLAPPRTFIGGPLLLSRIGASPRFGESITLTSGDEAGVGCLRTLFSELGVAAVLLEQNRSSDALVALAMHPCFECGSPTVERFPLDSRNEAMICSPGCARFAAHNPGYQGMSDGIRAFRLDLMDLASQAHFQRLELGMTRAPADLETLREAWEDLIAFDRIFEKRAGEGRLIELALGRANALSSASRLDEAVAVLRAVIDLNPHPRLVAHLSAVLTKRGIDAGNRREWTAAISDLREALAGNPAISHTRTNLITALLEGMTELVNDIDQLLAMLHEVDELVRAGLAAESTHKELKERQAQIRDLLAMADQHPERIIEWFLLARSGAMEHMVKATQFFEAERWDEAEAELDLVVAVAPNSTGAQVLRCKIYEQTNRRHELIGALRHLAELDPTERYLAHVRCARAYRELEEYVQSEGEVQTALALEPERGEAYMELGMLRDATGRYEEAIAAYERARAFDPETETAANLGIMFAKRQLRNKEGGASPEDSVDTTKQLLDLLASAIKTDDEADRHEGKAAGERETLLERLARQLLGGASTKLAPEAQKTSALLGEARLKFRTEDERTFKVPFKGVSVDVDVLVRAVPDLVFIYALLPRRSMTAESEMERLYQLLRGTNGIRWIKACRDQDGDLIIASELPLSQIEASTLRSMCELVALTAEMADNAPGEFLRHSEQISSRQKLKILVDALGGNLVETSEATARMAARVSAQQGWEYKAAGDTRFLVTMRQAGLFTIHSIGNTLGRSLTLTTTMGELRGSLRRGDRLQLYRRALEANLQMDLIKVSLDEQDDLMFSCELIAVDEALFQHGLEQLVQSLLAYGSELSELSEG